MPSVRSQFFRLMYEADVTVYLDRSLWDQNARDWDIFIRDESVFSDMRWHGPLGFMRAYVARKWECKRLDALFARLLKPGLKRPVPWWPGLRYYMWPRFSAAFGHKAQSAERARRSIHSHYDLGNEFYRAMLGPSMVYSCALWSDGARTLEAAQFAKMDRICYKLKLAPGDHLLDIGCGWGAFVMHAARQYGVEALGITLSEPQAAWANARIKEEGLQGHCRVAVVDYRKLGVARPFDKIVSVGMYEHVGRRNWPVFAQCVRRMLAPDGLFVLHTIVGRKPAKVQDPWHDRDIFPGTLLPAAEEVEAVMGREFALVHQEHLTGQYGRTLGAWCDNFERAWHQQLFADFAIQRGAGAANEFFRKWRLYLLSCKGGFDCGHLNVLQAVYAPRKVRKVIIKDHSFAVARQNREPVLA